MIGVMSLVNPVVCLCAVAQGKACLACWCGDVSGGALKTCGWLRIKLFENLKKVVKERSGPALEMATEPRLLGSHGYIAVYSTCKLGNRKKGLEMSNKGAKEKVKLEHQV
jgi:hypothetical protein